MQEAILKRLKASGGEYVSGEEISRRLMISRTAVWKHIQTLRQKGYGIEAVPKLGYRLTTVPDRLLPEEVKTGLGTTWMGHAYYYAPTAVSTNEQAKALADAGAVHGSVVVAERQTGGKGRLGREWVSPAGLGLWFSVILRPALPPQQTLPLTMLAALAVCRGLSDLVPVDIGIKWPNDLLIEGKKVCGILTEMKAEMDRVHYVVVGIGLNVSQRLSDFPASLRGKATSLALQTKAPVNRIPLLQGILEQMEVLHGELVSQGVGSILKGWRQWNCTLGHPVSLRVGEAEFTGRALDIDDQGGLVVRLENGTTKTFYSGEATLA